jgi:hypothetical protein
VTFERSKAWGLGGTPIKKNYLKRRKLRSPPCYEHARDQGTLGSVTGCRHNRTPGRTYGFLIGKRWPYSRPSNPREGLNGSHVTRDSQPSATIPTRWIARIARLSRLSRTTKVLYKTRSSPIR